MAAIHNIFVCSLPGPQYDEVALRFCFYMRASVLTIGWDSQRRTSGLVFTVRPCSRRVLVWRNGSAGRRTSLSSPRCSTNNSPSFPSPSECRLHTKRGKEGDGISKGVPQTALTSSCLSRIFWHFFHYNGLYLRQTVQRLPRVGDLIRYGTKPALCFGSPGVEPQYGRICYILLSSQFLQSSTAV